MAKPVAEVHQQQVQADGGRGQLNVRMQDGHVVLDFGDKKLSWVVFTPAQARHVASALHTYSMLIDGRAG